MPKKQNKVIEDLEKSENIEDLEKRKYRSSWRFYFIGTGIK